MRIPEANIGTMTTTWVRKQFSSTSTPYIEAVGETWHGKFGGVSTIFCRIFHEVRNGNDVFDVFIVDGARHSFSWEVGSEKEARALAELLMGKLYERRTKDPVSRGFRDLND